jgi:hypothetical protein
MNVKVMKVENWSEVELSKVTVADIGEKNDD